MSHTENRESADDMKKVAKGAGITFAGTVSGRGLWFLSQVIIARSFGAEVFGLYIIGLMVLKVTELIARLGLDSGAMRYVSIHRKTSPSSVKGVLLCSLLLSFVNGVFTGLIVYYLAGFISGVIFHNPELKGIIRLFAFSVPFMSAMMVTATASQGFHTAKYLVYIKDIIQPLANIVLIVLSLALGFGITGVCVAFMASYLIALAAGLYLLSVRFPGLRDRTLRPAFINRELVAYSIPMLFNGFLLFMINWTDAIMLGVFKTSASVGIYRAASQVPMFLGLIMVAFNSIYGPVIAEMHYGGKRGRMEAIFKATARWVCILALPASLLLIFSSETIMSIFGNDFVAEGAYVLMVLAVAQLVNCATGPVGFTLNMTGRQNVELANSLVLLLVNVVLNYLFIPRYGAIGAAVATAISISSINVLRVLEVFFFYRMHPFSHAHLGMAAGGGVSIALLYLLGRFTAGQAQFVGVLSNVAVVGIVFVLFFFFTGLRFEDRMIVNAIAEKLHIRAFKA